MSKPFDGGASFNFRHRLLRAAWDTTWFLLAAWTPPPLHRWRCMLLRLFGATIGKRCDVRGSARVWYPPNLRLDDHSMLAERVNCYNMALISLAEWALVSQGAHLCAGTHDVDDVDFQLKTKPIVLGRGCWIAAEAFVGPGVTVGENAVLGARAVAFSNLISGGIYAGNPAKLLRQRNWTNSERVPK